MDKIRIAIVDDHNIVRKEVCSILEKSNCQILFDASSGEDAIQKIEEGLVPDLIVMDITMPGMGGLNATRIIRRNYPSIKILILTVHPPKELANEAISAGASGYLGKWEASDTLLEAIKIIYSGMAYFSEEIIDSFFNSRQEIDYLPKDPTK